MSGEKLFSITELSEMTGISYRTIWNYFNLGFIRGAKQVKRINGQYGWVAPISAVDDIHESRRRLREKNGGRPRKKVAEAQAVEQKSQSIDSILAAFGCGVCDALYR